MLFSKMKQIQTPHHKCLTVLYNKNIANAPNMNSAYFWLSLRISLNSNAASMVSNPSFCVFDTNASYDFMSFWSFIPVSFMYAFKCVAVIARCLPWSAYFAAVFSNFSLDASKF